MPPAPILVLATGHADEAATRALAGKTVLPPGLIAVDQYDLDASPLPTFKAVLVGMHCDQRFLSRHARRLTDYVTAGGTVVISGHIAYPFLDGLSPFEPLADYRLEDIMVRRETEHPVWDGIAPEDLTFTRGVAGFYGRGWHRPPEGSVVVHSLGPARRPLDFTYDIGRGRVLLHGGNTLWSLGNVEGPKARLTPQLFAWAREESTPC